MAYTPKDWRDATTYSGGGDTSTPISAASLEDLEIRVTDYADSIAGSPPVTASDMLFGFADDEDNHQDFYVDALATGANSARIGVGYNAPGSAASLAAVAAYEADDQVTQVVVYLWSTTVISAATWATQAALACTQYPNALIELINEPNLNSFGGYTYTQAADATIAVVNACPAGRIIGPAVSQIGEQLGGDYLSYQAQMYDRIFDSVSPAQMAGVAFHLYPTTGDPAAELESHVDACYTAGLEQLPVFITELGFQYGFYGAYQPYFSAGAFDTYYNDERVGGIYYYRLAPQQPTPLPGETFQQYPLTTNSNLDAWLTDAFNTPPGGDPAPYAPLNSPTFTGNPTAPTRFPGDSDTSLATTAFVTGAISERLFRPEDYGAAADGVTDDTVAMQETIDAAMAWSATGGQAVVQLAAGVYLCNAAPRTDREGYCILSVHDEQWSQTGIEIRGVSPGAVIDLAYLEHPIGPNHSIIKTTRTTDAYSGTYGHPSVLGGGTDENGVENVTEYTGPVKLTNFIVQVPANPTIGGIDCHTWGGVVATDIGVVAGDPEDGLNATIPSHTNAFGFRTTSVWANNTAIYDRVDVTQFYVGFVIHHPDHQHWQASVAWYCTIGYAFQTDEPATGGYQMNGNYWMIEGCPYSLAGWNPTSGLAAIDRDIWFSHMQVQTEHSGTAAYNPVIAIYDVNNKLHGRLDWHHWGLVTDVDLPGSTPPGFVAGNLDVRNPMAGTVGVTRNIAPADGDVMIGQAQAWHDTTAGAPQLRVKSKDSAGTVRSYSLVGGVHSCWRPVFTTKCILHDAMANGFAVVSGSQVSDDTGNTVRALLSGEGVLLSNDHNTAGAAMLISPPDSYYIDDASFADSAGGLVARLRLVCTINVNATAPAVTFSITLRPADSAGAGDTISYTGGTQVVTETIASPTASQPTTTVGTAFAIPADGSYWVQIVTNGTPASGFAGSMNTTLEQRHIL